MAKRNIWDYECPQYIDFSSELDVEPKTNEWLGGVSPGLQKYDSEMLWPVTASPNHKSIVNIKTSTVVNKLATGALQLVNSTDSEKRFFGRLPKRLSKSEGSLCNVASKNMILCPSASENTIFYPAIGRKRSISEFAGAKPKKKTYPTTPMCLRRTLYKAKSKSKTSEELELEKIAALQQQTYNRLRSNEITLRRLGLKQPRCSAIPKVAARHGMKYRAAHLKEAEKDNVDILQRVNALHLRSQEPKSATGFKAVSTRSERINRVMSRLKEMKSDQPGGQNCPNETHDVHDGTSANSSQHPIPIKNYDGHSGLAFSLNREKKTACKPFNFCVRNSDSVSSVSNEKESKKMGQLGNFKGQFSTFMSTPRFVGKENISLQNIQRSAVKTGCKSGKKIATEPMKNRTRK